MSKRVISDTASVVRVVALQQDLNHSVCWVSMISYLCGLLCISPTFQSKLEDKIPEGNEKIIKSA